MRLDLLLVRKGLAHSREWAKELIRQGQVYVEGLQAVKPSLRVALDTAIEVKGGALPYASRAGLKLERALQLFQIDPGGLETLDVGASTGGFTSCLLHYGAKRVSAVDVGFGQLTDRLRQDPRVVVFEKTNIRDLTGPDLPAPVNLAVIDVSFISLSKVIPTVYGLLHPAGQIVALVKPQFETGGIGLNKQGVINDPKIHHEFLPPLINRLQQHNCGLLGFACSPLKGAKGNLEYLAYFQRGARTYDATAQVTEVIEEAWRREF